MELIVHSVTNFNPNLSNSVSLDTLRLDLDLTSPQLIALEG